MSEPSGGAWCETCGQTGGFLYLPLPEVTARRGGIRYPSPDPDAPPPRPPSRWQRARRRVRCRRIRVLHRVSVWIDPYQSRDDDWDDE